MKGLLIVLACALAGSAPAGVTQTPVAAVTSTTADYGYSKYNQRAWDVPFVGFDTWPAWAAAGVYGIHTGYETNVVRWVTNLANALNASGLNKRGYDSVWLTDGWQDTNRASGDLIQADFLPPIADIAATVHAAGCKLMLYTATATNTCAVLPGSPITLVERDIVWMMDRGVDGAMFDTCNNNEANSADYIRRYLGLVNKTIADYHARVISTQGVPRPFFIAFVTGNGAATPGTNVSSFSVADLAHTWSWNWQNEAWNSGGVANTYKVVMGGKECLKYASETRRGHYPWPTFLYDLPPTTNQMNMLAITSSHFRMRAGLAAVSLFTNGVYSGSGFGEGYEWYSVTNDIGNRVAQPEISAIHRDPGVIPPRIVWTNGLSELWVKPLGSETGPDKAIALINLSDSNHTVTVTADDLNINPLTTYTVRNPWLKSDVETFTGSFAYTIPSSNIVLLAVKPSASQPGTVSGVFAGHTFREATLNGTGASVATAVSFGPSPFFNVDGVKQTAGNQTYYFYFPTPPWARQATVVLRQYSEYAGTVAWTNQPGVEFYTTAGRVTYNYTSDSALSNTATVVSSGVASFTTNVISLGYTNAPRMVVMNILAGTNSSARHIIGPAMIKFD